MAFGEGYPSGIGLERETIAGLTSIFERQKSNVGTLELLSKELKRRPGDAAFDLQVAQDNAVDIVDRQPGTVHSAKLHNLQLASSITLLRMRASAAKRRRCFQGVQNAGAIAN